MQSFEAVFHFDNQAFRSFLADPWQFDQRRQLFTLNGIDKLLRRHAGKDRQRQLWTDAVGFNQLFKQRALLLVVKAIQQLGIFTDDTVGENDRLFTHVRQLIEAGHRQMNLIAYASRFK